MAFRVAYNLSQSPLVVSETGTVLAVAAYGAVSTTDERTKRLLDRTPAPLRLLTPSELKGKDLPDEVKTALEQIAELEAAEKAPADKADPDGGPAAKAPPGQQAAAADTSTKG